MAEFRRIEPRQRIVGFKAAPDDDHRRARDVLRLHLFGNSLQCRTDHFLIRPGRFMHDSNRRRLVVPTGNQFLDHVLDHMDAEENAHRGLMSGEALQALPLRHRRPALVPRDDDCLGNVWQRIFLLQRRRRREERADAGDDLILDVALFELVHLFLYSAVNRRIAGMQAHNHFPLFHGLCDLVDDFRQRHGRGIVNIRVFLGNLQHVGIDQRTRVNDDVRLPQKPLSLDRDEFGISGPRADNKYLHALFAS